MQRFVGGGGKQIYNKMYVVKTMFKNYIKVIILIRRFVHIDKIKFNYIDKS